MNLDDAKELKRRLGFGVNLNSDEARRRMAEVINAKLWFRGQPIVGEESEFALLKTSKHLLANLREKNRLLAEHHCPADAMRRQKTSNLLGSPPPILIIALAFILVIINNLF